MATNLQREALIKGIEEADRIEHELDAKDRAEDGQQLDKIVEQFGATESETL